MIKKFEAFNDDIDPYGEEDWNEIPIIDKYYNFLKDRFLTKRISEDKIEFFQKGERYVIEPCENGVRIVYHNGISNHRTNLPETPNLDNILMLCRILYSDAHDPFQFQRY